MTVVELKSPVATQSAAAFRNILVATDFSEASRRALHHALEIATENRAELSLVHVLRPDWRYATLESPPEMDLQRADAEQRLKALIRQEAPDHNIDIELMTSGPVADAVVSFIRESKVDLLVIGTRGRAGLSKLALGSVAEELLRVAPCPVMTIGPDADSALARGRGFGAILFATDFGQGSIAALPLALLLAKSHHAKLILLHMIPPMPPTTGSLSAYAPTVAGADELQQWEGASHKRALQQLRECLPASADLEQQPEFVVGTDFLAEGILTAADKFEVDLIVMGANHARSVRVAAHNPWCAVHEVVRHAPCPVLTVAG